MKSDMRNTIYLLVLGGILCVPVTSQHLLGQRDNTLPSLDSSFSLDQSGRQLTFPKDFLTGQSFSVGSGVNQRPFVSVRTKQPTQARSTQNKNEGDHTYSDGSMSGDYPSRLAEKRQKSSVKTHTYPNGEMGGDYPSHLAAKHGSRTSGEHGSEMTAQENKHTYPGMTGGNYPSKLTAQNKQLTSLAGTRRNDFPLATAAGRRQQQHQYPSGQFKGDYPAHLAHQRANQNKRLNTNPGRAAGTGFPVRASSQSGQNSGPHVYPNGEMGDDYPSHMTSQQGQNSGPHVYPDGEMGDDYPSHMAAQRSQGSGQHVYPNGQKGDNYPSHLTEQQNQNSPQHGYPNGEMKGDYPSHLAEQQNQNSPQHGYPNGEMKGDYPSHLAEQQNQNSPQHGYPNGEMKGDYPSHLAEQQNQNSPQHGYPNGEMKGDYPSHLAAQQVQNSGQHVYPNGETGEDYPSRMIVGRGSNSRRPVLPNKLTSGVFSPRSATQPGQRSPGQHVYANGQAGGDYPSHLAEQQNQNTEQHVYPNGQAGGDYPSHLAAWQSGPGEEYPGASSGEDYPTHLAKQPSGGRGFADRKRLGQPVPASSAKGQHFTFPQHNSQSLRQQGFPNSFRNDQVYPPTSARNQLFSSRRSNADTSRGAFSGVSDQNTFSGSGRPLPGNSSNRGSFPGKSFVRSQNRRPCFQYQNMAASYNLSDVVGDYPMEAIMRELRSKPYLAPMVGYERLRQPQRTSPFDSFDNSLSASLSSFQFRTDDVVSKLSNTKHFPANYDENTLDGAVKSSAVTCPAVSHTLQALTIDNHRCSLVNADYQAISYAWCKNPNSECDQCGAGGQGVSACVEHYNWVSVLVYCPHWQPQQGIRMPKLYLPQSCTCNRYNC